MTTIQLFNFYKSSQFVLLQRAYYWAYVSMYMLTKFHLSLSTLRYYFILLYIKILTLEISQQRTLILNRFNSDFRINFHL